MWRRIAEASALLAGSALFVSAWAPSRALGAIPGAPSQKKIQLSEKLADIRGKQMVVERELIDALKTQKQAKNNILKIQILMRLQKQEQELRRQRLTQLEKTIGELETRRGLLKERLAEHRKLVRRSLGDLAKSRGEAPRGVHLPARERIEAPRRKVLGNLVDRSLKEVEALKADLADADLLEQKIQEERQQLAYLFQDLQEQESVLELNRQLQADLLKKKHEERLAQLENYRKLKSAESQVEQLIGEFNARIELERAVETERVVSKAMMKGEFAKQKGALRLPIQGEILSGFGRSFDAQSNLYVFKKGIDIGGGARRPVIAVSAGKVAFSGELPNYGRLTILDHGEHFYSLVAHLGELKRQTGDSVAAGEAIGLTDDQGTPVYFEIRARNVAVNPLQWVSN